MADTVKSILGCMRGNGCMRPGAQPPASYHQQPQGPWTAYGGQVGPSGLPAGPSPYCRVRQADLMLDAGGEVMPRSSMMRRYPCCAGIGAAMAILVGTSCFLGAMGVLDVRTTFSKFSEVKEGMHRHLIVMRHHFSPTAAPADAVFMPRTTTTVTFIDCTLSMGVAGGAMSAADEAWCCREVGLHCVTTTTQQPTTITSTSTSGRFDCRLGDPTFWPARKRTWCCENEGFACEGAKACEAPCHHGGLKSTCEESVIKAALGRYAGESNAHAAAYALTLQTCPACAACALADVDFPTEQATDVTRTAAVLPSTPKPIAWGPALGATQGQDATQPQLASPAVPWSTTLPAVAGSAESSQTCSAVCTFHGKDHTCGARVRYSAAHEMQDRRNVCFAAYSHVLQQCPFCASCALADTGCMELYTTPKPKKQVQLLASSSRPFQCEDLPAHRSGEQAGWSASKTAWCCLHEQVGCSLDQQAATNLRQPKPPVTHEQPFVCKITPDRPINTWTSGEQAWCCENRNVGCVPTLAPPRLKK